jgi:NADH-quinone oxidoreductase subunit H
VSWLLVEVLAKSVFLVAVLLCGLVPAIAWIERRQQSEGAEGTGASDVGYVRRALQDLDAALRVLARPGEAPPHARRVLRRLTPAFAMLAPLTGFAWIPFAGVYAGVGRPFRGVAAESEVGALLVAAILMLACITPALAGFARQESDALHAGLRAAGLAASYQLPLLLAILGIGMVFGSLSLGEIAAAQDKAVPVAGLLEPSFGPTLPALADARLPAWGLFFQPLGFLVFFVAVLAAGPDAPIAADGVPRADLRPGLYRLAACVHVALVAALATTLFFGGFAIPGLTTAALVPALGKLFGAELAVGLCVVLHVVLFAAKLLFVAWLLVAARALLPRLTPRQWMRLCWLGLLPLATLNLIATAWVVAVWTGP